MTAAKSRKSTEKKEEQPLPTDITKKDVLARLGKPSDLHSVDVYRYDTMRCRVNVRRDLNKLTAEEYFRSQRIKDGQKKMLEGMDHSQDKTLTIITDSFYLKTNFDGSLRDGGEQIKRKY
jgi:hypothetical protein